MSTSSKRRKRSRKTTDRSATTDVVTQLEVAARNPHAAAIGALLGGLIPWFGRELAHGEIQLAWSTGNHPLALTMVAVVLGCGCFSGLSVYKFGKAAFGDPRKALGFVLALEGVMLVSHGTISAVALAVLIVINAVANGSVIALARDASQRKRQADARGAATRASNRAHAGTSAHEPRASYRAPVSTPVPVSSVVSTAPAKGHTAHSDHTFGHALVAPLWRRPSFDTVIDAEIVSEARFLA